MSPTKIAIACQGGGSHTAFTAGVLKSFFEEKIHDKYKIVSLSGTSGGAVCAALAWSSLLAHNSKKIKSTELSNRIVDFWLDNAAQNLPQEILNKGVVQYAELVEQGLLPEWKTSPSSKRNKALVDFSKMILPGFYDLEYLLKKHMQYDEVKDCIKPDSPVLMVGASDVIDGEFKVFKSPGEKNQDDVVVQSILASSAIPSIYPAVPIGETSYWDGLYSTNPPINELFESDSEKDNKPDQIWVIQINPKKRDEAPTKSEDIIDRSNEMIGNFSLYSQLKSVLRFNDYIRDDAFTEEYKKGNNLKHIDIYVITMSDEIMDSLAYSSKIDRSSKHIGNLINHGETRGNEFLKDPESMRYCKC